MTPIHSLAQLYLDGAAGDLARSALPNAPVRPVAPPARWSLRHRHPTHRA